MGALTRTVSPSVVSLTATPSVGKVTLTWPAAVDTFGQVVQTLTRTPPFAGAVNPTGSTYIDTAVTSGASYTYSLVVTDGRGLNSFTPAVSATVPSTGVVSKKWTPGFYMLSGSLTRPGQSNLSAKIVEHNLCQSSGPKVLGWGGRYQFGIVGNTPGTFDFSYIFADFNRLRALSPTKRIIIYILCQDYSSTDYTNTTPSYIYNNSAYGPSPVAGKSGWWYINGGTGHSMAFWRPAVMDFIISMWQALAATVNPQTGMTLDEDPFVEAICFNETAAGPFNTGPAGSDPTWSTDAIFTQYKRLIDAMVIAWPKTVFSVFNNFCQSKSNSQALTNYILQKGCAQGGPDTWVGTQLNSPQSLTWGQAAALGSAQGDPAFSGPDLRGSIGMLSITEATETTYRNPYTPITIFNQVNNVLRQGHCILTCVNPNATDDPIPAYPQEGKNTSANPGNWHQMMQVINGQTLTHTAKPSGLP